VAFVEPGEPKANLMIPLTLYVELERAGRADRHVVNIPGSTPQLIRCEDRMIRFTYLEIVECMSRIGIINDDIEHLFSSETNKQMTKIGVQRG
jgi:hypothetical protein